MVYGYDELWDWMSDLVVDISLGSLDGEMEAVVDYRVLASAIYQHSSLAVMKIDLYPHFVRGVRL